MDAIIATKRKRQGTSNHLPKIAIRYANVCRLYLNITMLNEICMSCGKHIHNWAMDGTQRNENTTLIYLYQEKPPPHVWKVWWECILATLLTKREVWRPTLHKSIQIETLSEEAEPWRNRIQPGMKLEEAVTILPGYI